MKKKLVWILIVLALLAGAGVTAFPHFRAYVKSRFIGLLNQHDRNIAHQMERIACEQTALFVIEHMIRVPSFVDRFEVIDHSLKSVDSKREGLYCEFGVYTGTSINYIASKIDRTIHGFDSFEGLPEDWRTSYSKGKFSVSELPKVRDNVKLHKGWFNESLPVWAKENPGPILFMHLDADLYSSTKTVFDVLGDRIVPGTVLQFDEYFNYPGWQEGEYKAFKEFVESRDVKFEYLAYRRGESQVSIRILSVGSSSGK